MKIVNLKLTLSKELMSTIKSKSVIYYKLCVLKNLKF